MMYDPEQIGKIIREERKKRGWTQDQLGKKLFISGKQVSNYEKGQPLPSMEVLLKMAALFNCEYGYLLGEESYKEGSKLNTAICQSLGLSGKAVDCLRTATQSGLTQELAERQRAISRFFESPYLGEFFDCLVDAAAVSNQLETYAASVYQKVVDRYGEERAEKAFMFFMSGVEIPVTDMDDAEIQEAKKEYDDAFDKVQSGEYHLKVARYKLQETFELLIRNLL